jgi:hypothetical protein
VLVALKRVTWLLCAVVALAGVASHLVLAPPLTLRELGGTLLAMRGRAGDSALLAFALALAASLVARLGERAELGFARSRELPRSEGEAVATDWGSTLRFAAAGAMLIGLSSTFAPPCREALELLVVPKLREESLAVRRAVTPRRAMTFVVTSGAGAEVLIDGVVAGATPLMVERSCRDGDLVRVEVRSPGAPPHRRDVRCEEGGEARVDR